jgi:hypothetical protein
MLNTRRIEMKFDLWSMWNRMGALLKKDEKYLFDGEIRIYALNDDKMLDHLSILSLYEDNIDIERDKIMFQNDLLIQMLYFATFREKANVRLKGFEEDILITQEELQIMSPYIDWMSAMLPYRAKHYTAQEFVNYEKDVSLYYSTYIGEDKESNPQVYSLSTKEHEYRFYPAFFTESHLTEFFEGIGRRGYMILNGTLKEFLEMLDSNSETSQMGVIVEPNKDYSTILPPHIRVN